MRSSILVATHPVSKRGLEVYGSEKEFCNLVARVVASIWATQS